MVIINTIDDKYFSLNGISYARIYQPLAQGSAAIGIFNKFDTSQQLVNSTNYDEYQINGVIFSSQEDAISELLTVVYSTISEIEFEGLENRVSANENKIVNLEENQVTGVEVYETYAELPAPGIDLVSYKVANDPNSTLNGYYYWSSAYVKEPNEFITDFKQKTIGVGYGQKYINEFGNLSTNASYTTREYYVSSGDVFRIFGNNRGASNIACYALYSGSIDAANLVDIVLISDRQFPLDSSESIQLDEFITIPDGVTTLGLVSVSAEYPQLLLFENITLFKNIDDKSTDNKSKIETLSGNKTSEVEFYSEQNEKYINYDGSIITNTSYITRVYDVRSNNGFLIQGQVRGTSSVACYAMYSGSVSSANLVYLAKIEDYLYPIPDGVGYTVTVNDFVTIPDGVTTIALVSVIGEDPQMLLYTAALEDYSLRQKKYIDTLGDSLTMGSSNFGYYQDSLQALVNMGANNLTVRNWGVGGEKTQTIMSRLGAVTIKFPFGFTLPLDGSEVEVANGTTAQYLRSTYNDEIISPLLQGANDLVNPCFINNIECTLTRYILTAPGNQADEVRYTLKRNEIGDRDVEFTTLEPVLFNTGANMGGSEISIVWMGTNGTYSDFNDLLEQHKISIRNISNKKYIIIGLHKLSEANGIIYEGLMRNEFGNKFFNLRQYCSTNMIYDAGITPTQADLDAMAIGECPPSLLYDLTHFNPTANAILGEKLHGMISNLGYL